MRKITEHTYGNHIYMRVELKDGEQADFDVYLGRTGDMYFRIPEHLEPRRAEIIEAFNTLY